MRYKHLFSPGRIGALQLRNRIIMCPMADGLAAPDGRVSDRQLAYYGARADGGAGLIIVGSTAVAYPQGAFAANMTGFSDTRYLEGLRKLTQRVHDGGAAIAAQLVHDGQYSFEDVACGRPLLVPTRPEPPNPDELALMLTPAERAAQLAPLQGPTANLIYREATDADLEWVIERFVAAALLAREAGFDGIEIHAGHGYLIDAFLSPAQNKRLDGWGGDIVGRARLFVEIVRRSRQALGREFPIWCRLNAYEKSVAGGETIGEAIAAAKLGIGAGLDAIHVTANANTNRGTVATDGHTPHSPGALLEAARTVKEAVDVPVIAFGRLDAEAAELALAGGGADFIAMGRKLIADPALPQKLRRDRADEVRPCIYHYRCIGNLYSRQSVACVVNADIGREERGESIAPASSSASPRLRVLIIGGGPAGLEAARLLASHHEVILAERTSVLGGDLALAAKLNSDLEPLLAWLVSQVHRHGVRVLLSTDGDEALVEDVDPDVILMATGGQWVLPDVPGKGLVTLVAANSRDWSTFDANGRQAVVLGAGTAALSIATALRLRRAEVDVIATGSVFASELGAPGRNRLVHDTRQIGVRCHAGATLDRFVPAGLHWISDKGRTQFSSADFVVAAEQVEPVETLRFRPRRERRTWCVGACASAHFIEGAMRSASDVAAEIAAYAREHR